MEADLTTWLLADTALTTLVGTRITWGARVQLEALPAVRCLLVSPGVTYTHDGATELASPRVQMDCWGATPESVLSVKNALTARMHEIRDGASGAGGLKGAFIAADRHSEPEDLGGGNMVFRRIIDFFVWHQ